MFSPSRFRSSLYRAITVVSSAITSFAVTGTVEGSFHDPGVSPYQFPELAPTGAAVVDISNGSLSSSFRWGKVETSAQTQSLFLYLSPGLVDATSAFDIGTFDYFNGNSKVGTGVKYTKLSLALDLGTGDQNFDFILEIENTDNNIPLFERDSFGNLVLDLNGDPVPQLDLDGNPIPDFDAPGNADIARILEPTASSVLAIGSEEYFLSISFVDVLGAGSLASGSELHVLEEQSASVTLRATLTSVPENVPDSGATLALLGTAFASLSLLRRYHRR